MQAQGIAYNGKSFEGLRQTNASEIKGNLLVNPLGSPLKTRDVPGNANPSVAGQTSPTKSSLSSKSRYTISHQPFDPENGIWSDEEDSIALRQLPPGKSLHRHAKSVTFDAAPPQVNEYDMTTPDPSSVASGSRDGSYDSADNDEDESFEQESSVDRDESFDASLEDTEKTPVVLPEDWRFMIPAVANEDLASHEDNPFDGNQGSPAPTARPSSAVDARISPTRTDSANSDGERRPLPPLPALGIPVFARPRSESNSSLSNTVDRISGIQRREPSPPRPASMSKTDIQGMSGCSMSLEERLRLMMLQDEDQPHSVADEQHEQRERRLRRGSLNRNSEMDTTNKDDNNAAEDDDVADLGDYKLPPRISRESILRKVKSRNFSEPEDEYSTMGLNPTATNEMNNIDPDVPIPSLESEAAEELVVIKEEPSDDGSEVDVYSIPDLYSQHLQAESYMQAVEKLEAFKTSSEVTYQKDDDDESHYSTDSKDDVRRDPCPSNLSDDTGHLTPRAFASDDKSGLERKESKRMSLPQFAALLGESDFGFGIESFMTPSPPISEEPVKMEIPAKFPAAPSPVGEQINEQDEAPTSTATQQDERPVTPESQLQPPHFHGLWQGSENEPGTPDSVIRHSIAEDPVPDSPGVPDPVATIKAPGAKLKTRPSITPADVEAMAEIRRQVSNGSQVPAVPKIPKQHMARPSVVEEVDQPKISEGQDTDIADTPAENVCSRNNSKAQRRSSLLPLEVPVEGTDSLGCGIEDEFDRVIEAQKVAFMFFSPEMAVQARSPVRAEYMPGQGFKPIGEGYANKAFRTQKGYLMRQNTKVIIASSASHESTESTAGAKEALDPVSRGTRSAGNSPRKPSASQPWTAEPWNGKIRRKSLRKSGGVPSKSSSSGPAPPMPGQQSNVASTLDSVTEDQTLEATEEIGEDGERGRLFVKVVRVKDLDLPLPKGERSRKQSSKRSCIDFRRRAFIFRTHT